MRFIIDTFRTVWNLCILSFIIVVCLALIAAISFACTFGAKLGIQVSQTKQVQQYVQQIEFQE